MVKKKKLTIRWDIRAKENLDKMSQETGKSEFISILKKMHSGIYQISKETYQTNNEGMRLPEYRSDDFNEQYQGIEKGVFSTGGTSAAAPRRSL